MEKGGEPTNARMTDNRNIAMPSHRKPPSRRHLEPLECDETTPAKFPDVVADNVCSGPHDDAVQGHEGHPSHFFEPANFGGLGGMVF